MVLANNMPRFYKRKKNTIFRNHENHQIKDIELKKILNDRKLRFFFLKVILTTH